MMISNQLDYGKNNDQMSVLDRRLCRSACRSSNTRTTTAAVVSDCGGGLAVLVRMVLMALLLLLILCQPCSSWVIRTTAVAVNPTTEKVGTVVPLMVCCSGWWYS
jgi:hypothetical protein